MLLEPSLFFVLEGLHILLPRNGFLDTPLPSLLSPFQADATPMSTRLRAIGEDGPFLGPHPAHPHPLASAPSPLSPEPDIRTDDSIDFEEFYLALKRRDPTLLKFLEAGAQSLAGPSSQTCRRGSGTPP